MSEPKIGPKEQARRDMREASVSPTKFVGKVRIAPPGIKTAAELAPDERRVKPRKSKKVKAA